MNKRIVNKNCCLGIVFLIIIVLLPGISTNANEILQLKPRIIVLTDLKRPHETDDTQSLVRLLTLADLVEIEGIVISSGFNYWETHHITDGYELAWELLDAYEKSSGNLKKMHNQEIFKTIELVHISALAGSNITLDASQSFDRKMDKLIYQWSVLEVPDSYNHLKIVPREAGRKASISIPKEANGKQLHILFELTDDGAGHPLTSIRRIIIDVQ